MPVLLTGGAGFIGSNFVRSWFESGGGALVNLDKLTYAGNPRNLDGLPAGAQHTFVHGDIADRDLVARLLEERDVSAIGVPFARASSACLSLATTSSGWCRFLIERFIGDSSRPVGP